jgi:hypothetical protein
MTGRVSRWRREQKNRKIKLAQKRAWLGVGFLLALFCLVGVSWLWRKAALSVWDGRSVISLVRQNEKQIVLSSYQPDGQRWIDFVIPGNVLLEVPFGYGEYQLKNVYSLGKLENRGGELLRRTVQEMMAVPVDGWTVEIKEAKETNLSWWDRLRLWVVERWLARKTVKYQLKSVGALRQEKLSDGSQVYRIEERFLDEMVNEEFFNRQISNEELAVAVVNASEVSGLAKIAARLAANLGSKVVWLGNSEVESDSSLILVAKADLKTSATVRRLKQAFKIAALQVGDVSEYRADVVIRLGKDYAQGRQE